MSLACNTYHIYTKKKTYIYANESFIRKFSLGYELRIHTLYIHIFIYKFTTSKEKCFLYLCTIY